MKYVFDLDGTLCTQEKSGEYDKALPIVHMVAIVNHLYEEGHDITIFTARGMNTYEGDLELIFNAHWNQTHEWLLQNGVKFHRLRFGKPAADYYVDDKAVTLEQIRARVKPWKKDDE